MNNKRLFFSLEGVDLNDDDALAAFAQQVWEQATAAFKEEQDNTEREPHHRYVRWLPRTLPNRHWH